MKMDITQEELGRMIKSLSNLAQEEMYCPMCGSTMVPDGERGMGEWIRDVYTCDSCEVTLGSMALSAMYCTILAGQFRAEQLPRPGDEMYKDIDGSLHLGNMISVIGVASIVFDVEELHRPLAKMLITLEMRAIVDTLKRMVGHDDDKQEEWTEDCEDCLHQEQCFPDGKPEA